MSGLRSLDQRRAAAAYRAIAERPDTADLAVRLPAMLQINGMLASWAFLIAKETKGEATPLQTLLAHLRTLPELEVPPKGDPTAAFLHWVGGAQGASGGVGGSLLRRLTAEALAFSVWLKRAAEAAGASPGDGGGDG